MPKRSKHERTSRSERSRSGRSRAGRSRAGRSRAGRSSKSQSQQNNRLIVSRSDDESDVYASKIRDRYAVGSMSEGESFGTDASELTSMGSETLGSSDEESYSEDESTETEGTDFHEYDARDYESGRFSVESEDIELMSDGSVNITSGWFDSACGWLDRPMPCIGFYGQNRNASLLQESKLKNSTAAIRSMKLNHALIKAAKNPPKSLPPPPAPATAEERRSIRLERKGLVDPANFQIESNDEEENAEKASKSKREREEGNSEDEKNSIVEDSEDQATMEESAQENEAVEDKSDEKPQDADVSTEGLNNVGVFSDDLNKDDLNKDDLIKDSLIKDDLNNEDLNNEDLNNEDLDNEVVGNKADNHGLEEDKDSKLDEDTPISLNKDVTEQANDQEDSESVKSAEIKPKEKELSTTKKRRIAAFRNRIDNMRNEESFVPIFSEGLQKQMKEGRIVSKRKNTGDAEAARPETQPENSDSLDRHEREGEVIEENRNRTLMRDQSDTRLVKAGLQTRDDEDEDIQSTTMNTSTLNAGFVSSTKKEESKPPRNKEPTADVMDLTHIEDEVQIHRLPTAPSYHSSHRAMASTMTTTSVDGKGKTVEVIDVLEFDDDDSWTPGEGRENSSAISSFASDRNVKPVYASNESFLYERVRDPSPTQRAERSRRDPSPSRFLHGAAVDRRSNPEVISLWEEEEEKLRDFSGRKDYTLSTPRRSIRDDIFNDPKARADFAGQRRGRLGTEASERKNRSRERTTVQNPQIQAMSSPKDDASVGSRRSRRSKSAEPRRPEVLALDEVRVSRPNEIRVSESPLRTTIIDHRQRATEHRYGVRDASPKRKDLVQIRSIDEAQKLRTPRDNRQLRERGDTRIPQSKSRDTEVMHYGVRPSASRDSRHGSRHGSHHQSRQALNVHDYSIRSTRELLETEITTSRSRDNRSVRSRDNRSVRDYRTEDVYEGSVRPSASRDSMYAGSTSRMVLHSPASRDHYKMHRSSSRGRMQEEPVVEMAGVLGMYDDGQSRRSTRTRDTRDDFESVHSRHSRISTRHSVKADPIGHFSNGQEYEDSRSRRKEKRSSRKDSGSVMSTSKELRRLEKKIGKQFKHSQKEKDLEEKSVYSSKELRKLEKQLVKKLKHEDEKRATRLKRLRLKKESKSFSTEGMSTTPEKRRPQPTGSTNPLSRRADDTRREKSKYNQLQELRSSRAMSKYVTRSRGPSPLRPELSSSRGPSPLRAELY